MQLLFDLELPFHPERFYVTGIQLFMDLRL